MDEAGSNQDRCHGTFVYELQNGCDPMTDEERTALEWRISEGLVQLGYLDVWRPADSCPQGHVNRNWPIGHLCPQCCGAGIVGPLGGWLATLRRWRNSPSWHPEWRIPKAPKRWTQDFEALTAALDWCFRERQWNWEMASEWPVDGPGRCG